jgi:phage anti-repressor protein
MIETFQSELGQSVRMTELYDYLELDKSNYSKFLKREIINSFYLEEGKDYSYLSTGNSKLGQRGQFRQEIAVHIDAAKKICMVSKSAKGNQIRNELVELTKKVENASLVSHSDVMLIMKMIKVFSIYEYRTLALNKNKDNFVQNQAELNVLKPNGNQNVYARFNNWRNEVLLTGKEVLAERVKEYCIIEQKAIPAKFTQDQALVLMGEYEQIKNAVWDLLQSKNKSEEMINNICKLAHDLSKEMKPFMQRLNQSNLFFDRIKETEVSEVFTYKLNA